MTLDERKLNSRQRNQKKKKNTTPPPKKKKKQNKKKTPKTKQKKKQQKQTKNVFTSMVKLARDVLSALLNVPLLTFILLYYVRATVGLTS